MALGTAACDDKRPLSQRRDALTQQHDAALVADSSPERRSPDAADATVANTDAAADSALIVSWRSLSLSNAFGPCPHDDCLRRIEITSDRLLRVDPFGAPGVVDELPLEHRDWRRVVAVVGEDSLQKILGGQTPACDEANVADVSERMTLQSNDGAPLSNATFGCKQQALLAARGLLNQLAAAYFPAQRPCDCRSGCTEGAQCLQSQFGGLGPGGVEECGEPRGPAECRPVCLDSAVTVAGIDPCPSTRPHCVGIDAASHCCSDAVTKIRVCCANADATDAATCR